MQDDDRGNGKRCSPNKPQQISHINAPLFENNFECRPATKESYEAYKSACNPSGSVEHCMREHMKQLYSAYGTLMRQGGENVTQREHREGRSWAGGPKDMGTELETYERLIRELKDPTKLITHGPGYVITKVLTRCGSSRMNGKNRHGIPMPHKAYGLYSHLLARFQGWLHQ